MARLSSSDQAELLDSPPTRSVSPSKTPHIPSGHCLTSTACPSSSSARSSRRARLRPPGRQSPRPHIGFETCAPARWSCIAHDEKLSGLLEPHRLDLLDVESLADGVQDELRASLIGWIVGDGVEPPAVVDAHQEPAIAPATRETVQALLDTDLRHRDATRLQPVHE